MTSPFRSRHRTAADDEDNRCRFGRRRLQMTKSIAAAAAADNESVLESLKYCARVVWSLPCRRIRIKFVAFV